MPSTIIMQTLKNSWIMFLVISSTLCYTLKTCSMCESKKKHGHHHHGHYHNRHACKKNHLDLFHYEIDHHEEPWYDDGCDDDHLGEDLLKNHKEIDPHAIHIQLANHTNKLDELTDLAKLGVLKNKKQNYILGKHSDLIDYKLDLQKEDEQRDLVKMEKQDMAVRQRMDMMRGIDTAKALLKQANLGQGILLHKQNKMNYKADAINQGVADAKQQLKANSYLLDDLHMKADEQRKAQRQHDEDFQQHVVDQKIHDKKQDMLKDMFLKHNAEQAHLMGQVMVNQKKLNSLKNGQKMSHGIMLNHAVEMDKHAQDMSKYVAHQRVVNNLMMNQMDKINEHMLGEKQFMNEQKEHQEKEDLHMEMEALHMAEAEDHHNQPKHLYRHKHYRHKHLHNYDRHHFDHHSDECDQGCTECGHHGQDEVFLFGSSNKD